MRGRISHILMFLSAIGLVACDRIVMGDTHRVDFAVEVDPTPLDREPDHKGDEWVAHWVLDVPTEYLYTLQGKSGIPEEGRGLARLFGRGNFHQVRLLGRIDPETYAISPRQRFEPSAEGDFTLMIKNTSLLIGHNLPPDLCLFDRDRGEFFERESSRSEECRDRPLCGMSLATDGWKARASVWRGFEAGDERVCEALRGFLQDMTVHQDDVTWRHRTP